MAYKPNDFGLFDVHGNVAEWTADCFAPSYRAGQPIDGSAYQASNCRSRVVRGGSWNEGYGDARSAARGGRVSDYRDDWIGLRVARDWR
jgi:formylglycine-generating enzyme required for sulfatase activity